jgi:hypothetical protein
MPIRIQRKRTKGWKMPDNAVSITRPGKWGNPSTVAGYHACFTGAIITPKDEADALRTVLDEHRQYVWEKLLSDPCWLAPLKGKDLACWCRAGQACHGDYLLELANNEDLVDFLVLTAPASEPAAPTELEIENAALLKDCQEIIARIKAHRAA